MPLPSLLSPSRNLSKPIAVQSKEKEDRYVANYRVSAFFQLFGAEGVRRWWVTTRFLSSAQYLEEEYRKGIREDDPMPPVQPYHYGSHYSNSGTVLHFLVRMPPFTKMFLAYQGDSRRSCDEAAFPERLALSFETTFAV